MEWRVYPGGYILRPHTSTPVQQSGCLDKDSWRHLIPYVNGVVGHVKILPSPATSWGTLFYADTVSLWPKKQVMAGLSSWEQCRGRYHSEVQPRNPIHSHPTFYKDQLSQHLPTAVVWIALWLCTYVTAQYSDARNAAWVVSSVKWAQYCLPHRTSLSNKNVNMNTKLGFCLINHCYHKMSTWSLPLQALLCCLFC
jgi:hypothetical protein